MQNMMFLDSNISYIQNVINSISKSITDLKLYCLYFSNNEQILNTIKNNEVDIIILNIDSFSDDILNFIFEKDIVFYKKSIIILSDNIEAVSLQKYNTYIYKLINYNDIDNLIKTLRDLTYIKEKNYDNIYFKIVNFLRKLGYNTKHIGTQYLIEALEFLYYNDLENVSLNDVYYYLALKHQKPSNTIKGVIRRATEYMYKNYTEEFIVDCFDYLELVKLPTISEIMFTIPKRI